MQSTGYGKRQSLIDAFLEINTKINLSAIRDAEGVYHKHILDSIEISKIFDTTDAQTLLDVGTGGGFPLLPLAITYPHIQCTGLDATRKKCSAVESLAQELGLTNVDLLRGRAEELSGKYDIVTSRSVGYADTLFFWTAKFVKAGGFLLRWKMYSPDEDIYIADHCKKYKLVLEGRHEYTLENDEITRVIYIMRKKR